MDINPKGLSLTGRLKFLLKDSVVYGGASAIRTLFALFTFPILTRYFSIEDYGVIDAFNVLATLLTVTVIFGQDSAVARFFYEYDDRKKKQNVVSQSLLMQFVLLLISLPILLFFADDIASFYVKRDDLKELAVLVIWQVPFALAMNFSANLLKWTFKKWQFLIIQLGSSFSQVLIIVISIYYFKIGISHVFIIALAVRAFFSLLGIFFIREWLIIKLDGKHFKELLHYGIPLGLLVLIFSFVPVSDRYFINSFLTPADLGLYAVGLKIAMLVKLPISAFQTAWGPFYLSLFKEDNAEKTYNTVLLLFTIFVSIIGLGLGLFAKELILILAGKNYINASNLVLPLVFGTIIMSFGWILSIGIDLSKKSYQKFISAIIRLTVSIGVILILIDYIGLMAIGVGFIVSYIVLVIYETIIAYKLYPLRFDLYYPISIIGGSFLLVLLSFLIDTNNILVDIAIKIGIISGFIFVVWLVPLKRKNLLLLIRKKNID